MHGLQSQVLLNSGQGLEGEGNKVFLKKEKYKHYGVLLRSAAFEKCNFYSW